MNKKIMIIIGMIVLLCSFVYGFDTYEYYRINVTAGGTTFWELGTGFSAFDSSGTNLFTGNINAITDSGGWTWAPCSDADWVTFGCVGRPYRGMTDGSIYIRLNSAVCPVEIGMTSHGEVSGNTKDFTVEASTDNITWQTLVDDIQYPTLWTNWTTGLSCTDIPIISGVTNNSHHNTIVEYGINFTLNVSGLIKSVNCSLIRNNTNTSIITQIGNTFNVSVGSSVSLYINDTNFSSITENPFIYKINCSNSTGGTVNSSELWVYVDNVNPLISLGGDINSDNSSYIYNDPTISVTFTDNYLFRTIFNITNSSGNQVFVNDSGNLSGVTTYTNSTTLNTTGYADQQYNITLTVADTHTKNKIPNYDLVLDKNKNKHSYTTEYDNKLSITLLNGGTDVEQLLSRKEVDRHIFGYKFTSKKQRELDIELGCDGTLYSINDDQYDGHFICSKDGITGNWIDFEGQGRVTKYQKNGKWRVKVQTNKDFVEFQSIGGLNVVTRTITFHSKTFTENTHYNTNVVNSTINANQTFIFELLNVFGDTTPTATMNYNGTIHPYITRTNTSPNNYNFTFNEIIPIISFDYNYSRNLNFTYNVNGTIFNGSNLNQTWYKWQISNCTGLINTQAINFSFRNKTDESSVESTLSGYFTTYYDSNTETTPYNITWINPEQDHSLCLYPSFANGTISADLEYVNDTRTRTYYLSDANIDNTTNSINLYFVDGTTQVLFYVIDENDDEVINAYISVREHDIPTNSDTLTEILRTDTDGQALANIILNTQSYTFIVTYDGVIVLETLPTIITVSPKTLRISLGTDYFSNYETVLGITGNVEFDNTTKIFSYTFIDPSGLATQNCLEIVKTTSTGTTIINETCISASSGTISTNISTEVFDATFVGTGTATVSTLTYLVDVESVSFNFNFKRWGTEGIFMTFFIVLALAMIGVSSRSPAITIVLTILGLIGSVFATIFFVEPTILLSAIIMGGVALYFVTRIRK